MVFWIDADSCPAKVREMVARRAHKNTSRCVLVSCQPLPIPPSAEWIQVEKGPDSADQAILEKLEENDLVITRDLRLAQRVLEKGAAAMNDRGQLWQKDLVRERISLADFSKVLYDSGLEDRRPNHYAQKDLEAFAKGFDRWVQSRTE